MPFVGFSAEVTKSMEEITWIGKLNISMYINIGLLNVNAYFYLVKLKQYGKIYLFRFNRLGENEKA